MRSRSPPGSPSPHSASSAGGSPRSSAPCRCREASCASRWGSALVAAVFAQFHTLNGLVPGTAMLMLMAAIKLLETRSQRDQYVVIGGALFLLLAACLYAQALVWVPLYGAQALLCCAALAVVAYAPGSDQGRSPAPGLPTREAVVACGPHAAFRHTARHPAVSLLSAPARPLLGPRLRRRGRQRSRRYADTRRHHPPDRLLCHRLQGPLRRRPAAARRALLARPGAA